MGVDHSTIFGIGKLFENSHKAEEYFREKYKLTEEQEEELDKIGLEEFLSCAGPGEDDLPFGETINCYSGDGFWIGYSLNTYDEIVDLKLSIEYGESQWRKVFGDEPEIIDQVRVW
jgi:hypothetical protein